MVCLDTLIFSATASWVNPDFERLSIFSQFPYQCISFRKHLSTLRVQCLSNFLYMTVFRINFRVKIILHSVFTKPATGDRKKVTFPVPMTRFRFLSRLHLPEHLPFLTALFPESYRGTTLSHISQTLPLPRSVNRLQP